MLLTGVIDRGTGVGAWRAAPPSCPVEVVVRRLCEAVRAGLKSCQIAIDTRCRTKSHKHRYCSNFFGKLRTRVCVRMQDQTEMPKEKENTRIFLSCRMAHGWMHISHKTIMMHCQSRPLHFLSCSAITTAFGRHIWGLT